MQEAMVQAMVEAMVAQFMVVMVVHTVVIPMEVTEVQVMVVDTEVAIVHHMHMVITEMAWEWEIIPLYFDAF